MERWGTRSLRISPLFLLCPTPSTPTARQFQPLRRFLSSTSQTLRPRLPSHDTAHRASVTPGCFSLQKRSYRRSRHIKPTRSSPLAFNENAMNTSLQVNLTPTSDTPHTCLYLRNDGRGYVFGRVAEGTQRSFVARKTSFMNTSQIFLSGSVGWDQVGGLTGYLLNMAAAHLASRESLEAENLERQKRGNKILTQPPHEGVGIHAGDNISHILACQRSVIFRQAIRAHTHEFRKDHRATNPDDLRPDWEDDALRVWKVPATRERSSSPRKRRRLSADGQTENNTQENGEEFKDEDEGTLSDPEVARILVDRLIWNGELKDWFLVARDVGDLKPDDTAFILKKGSIRLYRGPYSGGDQVLENPDSKAWVLPPAGVRKEQFKGQDIWSLEHIPLPKTRYSQTSMSYIAKTQDRRGKFDRAAAEARGVDRKDFKFLVQGQDVKGSDGSTVTPAMVMGEPLPGRGFIVADISGVDFIDSFMQRAEWSNKELMANVVIMYWMLGPGLASHPRVQQFVKEHPDIQHVFCAPETCPNMITNTRAAELQMMLRRIDSDRFRILHYDNAVQTPANEIVAGAQSGRTGVKMQLMPRYVFEDDAGLPFIDLVAPYKSVPQKVLDLAEAAKAKATDPAFLAKIDQDEQDIPSRDAEITALGTGSSVPSLHRNVSSTLIRVPGIGNYLLDAGEGTLGQIRRLFGPDETAVIMRDLKCIAISHLHADHHLGCVSVIKAWYHQALADGSNARLAVSCIDRYRNILSDMAQVEDFGFHRLYFPNCPLRQEKVSTGYDGNDNAMTYADRSNRKIEAQTITAESDPLLPSFGLDQIKHVPVQHCWRSVAIELKLTSGLRIAYSGDCRPSSTFAQECKGAHLLIHECTFADNMADHAKHKMHSTMSEALGVAAEMQARRTLLTHFSQRYTKSDTLFGEERAERDEDGREREKNVLMAFDYMSVKLGDFQKAACYLPALEKLMEEED